MELPSLNSPERSGGDGWCWANLQNTHFSGLTRKNRVCVNQPDRLTHPAKTFLLCLPFLSLSFSFSCLFAFAPALHQKLVVESPSLNSPERMRRRWLVLGEFAKYAFFWTDKEKSCF